jgi:hypothetical protein
VLRRLSVGLVVLALAPGGVSVRTSGGAEEAYVAVEDEHVVAAVALDAGRVVARIRVPTTSR